jgi:hypothetical protein
MILSDIQSDIPSGVVHILSFGTIGLGYFLASWAFRLLKAEQSKNQPNKAILRAIDTFMGFSIILCSFGLAAEAFHFFGNKPQEQDALLGTEWQFNEPGFAIPNKVYFLTTGKYLKTFTGNGNAQYIFADTPSDTHWEQNGTNVMLIYKAIKYKGTLTSGTEMDGTVTINPDGGGVFIGPTNLMWSASLIQ